MQVTIPIEDVPDASQQESEQVGRALEAILPAGAEYVVIANVPGSACPSVKSESHIRFISNVNCYAVVLSMLASLAEQLMDKPCPHNHEESGNEDPGLRIIDGDTKLN